jgi:hypothetical protein
MTTIRRSAQRDKLTADGARALKLVQVLPIYEVLAIIGGSRARLYRALDVATKGRNDWPQHNIKRARRHEDSADSVKPIDPLLL